MARKTACFGSILLALFLLMVGKAQAIPNYARQTNLSCDSCHIVFPRLNSFGRLFKLNGYTLTGIRSIEATGGETPPLKLTSFMPMSAMAQASQTYINKAEPGKRSYATEFPQQLSFFIAGEITPHLGTFIQITYEDQTPNFEWDNTDIRFALARNIGKKRTILGLTLNNGPTVQDVWNTTPAWGFPFASSSSAPTPQASTLIEGQLNGQVAGLGAYIFYNNLAYGELTFYVSTPQGGPFPADATSVGTIQGLSPYWRFALQRQLGATQYLSFGTYGLVSRLYPLGIVGATDRYTDIGLDIQYERTLSHGGFQFYATWIHESQSLGASFLSGSSANVDNHLQTLKLNASYNFRATYSLTLGYFDIWGSRDSLIYVPDAVTGSRLNAPNSSGFIFDASLFAWQNARITLQYVLYSSFNGTGSNYDGFGRNASDNNTLYLLLWLAF
jgi:hypothetical protein